MLPLPHEFAIGGVYLPPLLVAGVLAVIATVLTTRLLNRYRMSRYVFYPPLVLLALAIIYTVVLGTFIIPG
jgi:type II secretory pathway component PulF